MNAFLAVIRRDLTLATRNAGDTLTLILFFVMVGAIVPFAVGPDRALLARIAPGIVWVAALLSSLLAIERLFSADHADGSLTVMRQATISLEAIAFAKLIAFWLTTVLPLIAAVPVMLVLFGMDTETFWRTELSLLCGTPALTAFGAVGAAVTVSLRRGGLIAPVLIIPLSVPVLIFGVGAIADNGGPGTATAALTLLCAISLVTVAFAPFAAALALKLSEE